MVTKEDVKKTLDCVFIRKTIKVGLIFLAIAELFTYISIMIQYRENIMKGFISATVPGVMFLIFFAIPCICCFCKYRSIVNNYKNYDVYEVVLDTPKWVKFQGGRGGRAYRYIVTFTTKHNQTITTKTSALWSDGVFSVFDKRDYDNKKVKILYDEQKDKVYVLGKVKRIGEQIES
ncbi:MAG: hypothetical protein IKK96_00340 [Lachnospiraceae bacterium]|nr:hypothetical protein [Lachnospiraceae bacterium]